MKTTEHFNSSRLSLARRRRGLTKATLAERIGVDARSISGYENGEFKPDDSKLVEIAKTLQFPIGFFCGDDVDEPTPDVASFRAMSKMTARQRNMALGAGASALLLNTWIEDRFELPTADLPDLSREPSPEAAADSLRQIWGLGELPIKHIVHLLEAKGVRVYSLVLDADEVDAFSMWRANTPYVFLNTRKSCEHSRFDAAHELGHLVMHRHGSPQGQDAEREANAFASALLMPRASVLSHAPKFATLDHLIKLKKLWTVSVAALVYRLHTLEIISDWHYRTLCIEIAKRGYRKREPEEAPREISQVLAKVFGSLREEGVTKLDIANDLDLPVEEIDQLVFGLALTSIASSRQGPTPETIRHADLRIIYSKD